MTGIDTEGRLPLADWLRATGAIHEAAPTRCARRIRYLRRAWSLWVPVLPIALGIGMIAGVALWAAGW